MKQLFLPLELREELESLLRCDDRTLAAMSHLLNTKEGAGGTYSAARALSEETGIAPYPAYQMIRVVRFLADQRQACELNDDACLDQLATAYPTLAGELHSKRTVLADLLGQKPEAELIRKKEGLSLGIIPTMVGIRGVCDIRPVFDKDRTAIVDWVPVVLTRMTLEDDQGEEDKITLQFNEDSLKKLERFLDATKQKLAIAMRELSGSGSTNE